MLAFTSSNDRHDLPKHRVKGERLQDIQVLRAVACLMVIFEHLSLTATLFEMVPGPPTRPFYLGVQLFFVISGFVVTRSLFQGALSPFAFLIRRFFRLTPAIVAFLVFSLFVFALIARLPDQAAAKSLLLTGPSAFISQSFMVLTGTLNFAFGYQPLYYFSAMWSLSVEYQFYAAYAGLVGVMVWAGFAGRGLKGLLLLVVLLLLSITFAARIGILSWPMANWGPVNPLSYMIRYWFDFLLLGVALALAIERHGPILLPRRSVTILIGVLALAITLVVGAFAEPPFAEIKPIHDRILMPIAAVSFTLLVALASGSKPVENQRSRAYRVLTWLGDRSFSMYLLHFPVMALVWWADVTYPWIMYGGGALWYGIDQAPPVFIVTIVMADLIFRFVERPWNKIGHRISARIASQISAPGFIQTSAP